MVLILFIKYGVEYETVKNTNTKAAVWQHFALRKRKSDSIILPNIAICKLCNSEVKYSGGTSNLTAHLRVHHLAALGMHGLACIPVKNDTNNNAIGTPAKSQVHPVQSSSQQTLPNILAAKYPSKSSKVMTITDYIANFIIKDLRPYRIVDSPEFRTMVKALDPRY